MSNLRLIFVVTLTLAVMGCSFLDSGYDIQRQPDGTGLLLDTPRMWVRWEESVNDEVPREVKFRRGDVQGDSLDGRPQGGGTWNNYWLQRIHALQSGDQEHPQKYIDYIIQQRREAGLPALVGYPKT